MVFSVRRSLLKEGREAEAKSPISVSSNRKGPVTPGGAQAPASAQRLSEAQCCSPDKAKDEVKVE